MKAALALGVADRPPVSAWGHVFDQEWGAASLAAASVAIAREHSLDFLKLQIRATSFAEAFGARWHYSGSPEREPVMDLAGGVDADEWRRIAAGSSVPAILAEQVEAVRLVATELGPDVPVLQTVFSPGMIAWFLAGRDLALLRRLMTDDPALLAAGLDRIAEAVAGFTRESLAAGAAGVFYAINPLADTTLVSAEEYASLFLRSDRIAVEAAAGGWFNMLHLCGGNINEGLVSELGMNCVNWAAEEAGNAALEDLRDRLGVAVAGGVGRYSLIRYDDPGALREVAAEALARTSGRGHLLTPGCSSSPWGQVRPANLRALIAAAESVGEFTGEART